MCNLQNCDLLFPMTFSSSSALFSASSNVLAGALVSAITVQNAQKCPNRVSEECFKLIWVSLKLSRSLLSSPGVSQAHQGVFCQDILWVQSRERGEENVVLLKRSSGRRPLAGLAARWSSSSLLQGSPCLVLRKRRGTPAQLREPEPLACPQPQDGAQVTQD